MDKTIVVREGNRPTVTWSDNTDLDLTVRIRIKSCMKKFKSNYIVAEAEILSGEFEKVLQQIEDAIANHCESALVEGKKQIWDRVCLSAADVHNTFRRGRIIKLDFVKSGESLPAPGSILVVDIRVAMVWYLQRQIGVVWSLQSIREFVSEESSGDENYDI